MRACGVVALLACFAPLAMAQWTAEEQTLISDTLSLGNLRPEDLNYEKQLSRASRTSSFITFALNDPLGGAAEQWRLHGSVSGATTAKLLGEADQLLGGKGNAAVLEKRCRHRGVARCHRRGDYHVGFADHSGLLTNWRAAR